jgi:hypothetical protein
MKKLASALLAALAMTVCALGADVTFKWDNDPTNPGEGSTLRWFNDLALTDQVGEREIVGLATEATVPLDKGVFYVVVYAWADTENPDGTQVRGYSDPSNILEVKIAGKSANVRVVDATKTQ